MATWSRKVSYAESAPARALQVLRVALIDFTRSNSHYVAAGIAYFALLSLFPLTLAAISVLGYLNSDPQSKAEIVQAIIDLIPVSEDYLSQLVDDVARSRGTVGVLAIIGLLWSGTAVFSGVRKGINHTWQIGQPPNFLLERAIDLVMLLAVAILAFLQVTLATTNILGLSVFAGTGGYTVAGITLKVALQLGALGLNFAIFALLYRYVPNTRVEWREVWIGAAVGAVLFQIVRIGFAWFVASFSSFNLVYGSLGALVAVLVWAYLSALAIMLGSQLAYTSNRVVPAAARSGQDGVQGRLWPNDARGGTAGLLDIVASWLRPPKRGPR